MVDYEAIFFSSMHVCRFVILWGVLLNSGHLMYQDPAVTDIACGALNGLKMGDKTLTVRRATLRFVFLIRDRKANQQFC